MKIISKFKDFYDYKVAKYGVDENQYILERLIVNIIKQIL